MAMHFSFGPALKANERPTLQQRFAALRYIPPLIKLVWEMERDRAHTRRTRDQLLNLQRVRELLGMGNTLVAGDSQTDNPSGY